MSSKSVQRFSNIRTGRGPDGQTFSPLYVVSLSIHCKMLLNNLISHIHTNEILPNSELRKPSKNNILDQDTALPANYKNLYSPV
jgi:hypothetical protein